jgi:hypothetical protein
LFFEDRVPAQFTNPISPFEPSPILARDKLATTADELWMFGTAFTDLMKAIEDCDAEKYTSTITSILGVYLKSTVPSLPVATQLGAALHELYDLALSEAEQGLANIFKFVLEHGDASGNSRLFELINDLANEYASTDIQFLEFCSMSSDSMSLYLNFLSIVGEEHFLATVKMLAETSPEKFIQLIPICAQHLHSVVVNSPELLMHIFSNDPSSLYRVLWYVEMDQLPLLAHPVPSSLFSAVLTWPTEKQLAFWDMYQVSLATKKDLSVDDARPIAELIQTFKGKSISGVTPQFAMGILNVLKSHSIFGTSVDLITALLAEAGSLPLRLPVFASWARKANFKATWSEILPKLKVETKVLDEVTKLLSSYE